MCCNDQQSLILPLSPSLVIWVILRNQFYCISIETMSSIINRTDPVVVPPTFLPQTCIPISIANFIIKLLYDLPRKIFPRSFLTNVQCAFLFSAFYPHVLPTAAANLTKFCKRIMFYIRALNKSLYLWNKTNKSSYMEHVLSHNINYQHVSVAFVIIIRVALQEY